ncbi:MAG: FCD domain-containing protein, partial [Desulfobacterales bacterium]
MIHLVVLPVDNKLLLSFAGTVCSQGYSTVFPATNFFNALLRIVPRTGAIVTEIEFHKMRHVFQIRAEIEDLAGRLAAENINPAQLNGIEKLVQACEKLAKMPQNSKKLIELDLKFRDILYEAADNPVLKDQSQHL